MTAYTKTMWLLVGLLISAHTLPAFGQLYDWVDTPDHELQFFSPVNLDFDDKPVRRSSGYFFHFDKLNWAITGERSVLGTTNLSNASTNPWREFDSGGISGTDPNDDDATIFIPGTPITIAPPLLPGGIQNSPPRAVFGWGERYEFGHFNKNAGWMVGILDGPVGIHEEIFGFGFTGQDDTATVGVGLPSPFPGVTPPNQLISPLGSVLIVFNDPQGLMTGFLDVVNGVSPGLPGTVLGNDVNGDGILDGDGFADDIDRDGHFGPDGFEGGDPGEVPNTVGGAPADFDDLVTLPTSFQTVFVRNSTAINGIEFMRTHRLSNRHHMQKHQNNEIEFSYGARYVRLRDEFVVNGFGGVLGTSSWDTRIDNNMVGPQVALRWLHQRNRMRLDWGGRFLFGYNVQNWEQDASLGEDLIPGQNNHPLYFPPTVSNHGRRDDDFSPVVEMRVQASYQLTSSLSAKLGYNALFMDNIRRAAQQVDYTLPSMGFIDGGTQDIFINGANFGFDVVY